MPTTVWIASLQRTGPRAHRLGALLTAAEQARGERFLHSEDRRRFVLGRALARLAAASLLSCDAAAVRIATEPGGRPRIDAARGAPSLSIAHGGDLVAVALAEVGDVGVDVEPLTRAGEMAALASVACSASEAHALRSLEPAARGRRLLALWTLKEACLKASGHGLHIDPREVVFEWDAGARPALIAHPHAADAGELAARWTFALREGAGHLIALALRGAARGARADSPAYVDADALLAPRLADE